MYTWKATQKLYSLSKFKYHPLTSSSILGPSTTHAIGSDKKTGSLGYTKPMAAMQNISEEQ